MANQNPFKCGYCRKSKPNLLRCSQCRSAWYCDRTCQLMAWNGHGWGEGINNESHRRECRRIRKARDNIDKKRMKKSTKESSVDPLSSYRARDSLSELLYHVKNLDREEAYRRLCQAQEEVKRLQSFQKNELGSVKETVCLNQNRNYSNLNKDILGDSGSGHIKVETNTDQSEKATRSDKGRRKTSKEVGSRLYDNNKDDMQKRDHLPTNPAAQGEARLKPLHGASGIWLDEGGNCSVEYLSNVNCYSITLSSLEMKSLDSLLEANDKLWLSFLPVANNKESPVEINEHPFFSYYEAKLWTSKNGSFETEFTARGITQNKESSLLLFMTLPVPAVTYQTKEQHYPIEIFSDATSISFRLQLQPRSWKPDDGSDFLDRILRIEHSSPLSQRTDTSDINFLHCRACQHHIIESSYSSFSGEQHGRHNWQGVIKSVLPLPSCYWDEITDYLSCYDGQANVDFSSSASNAIRSTVLEDDVILMLHRKDLGEGGICTLGVGGYGEQSYCGDDLVKNDPSLWVDRSTKIGVKRTTVACANCCSSLGFVSDSDLSTFRLYKHLLGCGKLRHHLSESNTNPDTYTSEDGMLANCTCSSFLAHEMVRYAESQAVYTFVVGITDSCHETNSNNEEKCILLQMLSWDTGMATVDRRKFQSQDCPSYSMKFQKVLKIIFEEIDGKIIDLMLSNDNSTNWIWGDIDFCCIPPNKLERSKGTQQFMDDGNDLGTNYQEKKTSSLRIYFSLKEWLELKDFLISGSNYFSKTVRDALLMTKLGKGKHSYQRSSANLSFLPLV